MRSAPLRSTTRVGIGIRKSPLVVFDWSRTSRDSGKYHDHSRGTGMSPPLPPASLTSGRGMDNMGGMKKIRSAAVFAVLVAVSPLAAFAEAPRGDAERGRALFMKNM